ncbi:MAG: MFS transporter [Erysipelotrichaceae bacterium]
MRNVIFLGLISFFSDISSEMVYPLIPLYLTSAFGATPTLVGFIEGIAESVASLLKVFSGYIADKYKHKKPIAFTGYALGMVYKLALLFATSWFGILFARVIDRIGKGIRSAPRDVMVAESASQGHGGSAFGIHKALDMAGSAIGIFLSFILLKSVSGEVGYKQIFIISIIPALLGLVFFHFVKEKPVHKKVKEEQPSWEKAKGLNTQLKLYLFVCFLFTLGNSSNTFLLLRAGNVGFSNSDVILLYFIYNLSASLLAYPLGKLSDKIGRKSLLVCGYLVFSIVYFGFGFANSKAMMVLIFVLYGVYTAMSTGVERAFIAEIAPPELKGTMLGFQSMLVGVALLPASFIAGLLWDHVGAYAPFVFGACLSLLAAIILAVFLKKPKAEVASA